MTASECVNCSRPLGWMARFRGATLCDGCARSAVREGQATLGGARTLHPEHAWGHHFELPPVSDWDMRKLVERIARAMPSAAKATTEAEQRAAIASVSARSMECAARMNGTPTDDCWSYVAASDGMAKAREIMAAEYPDYPLFTAYWRVWWTAAARLGRPVAVEQIVDNTMAEDAAEAALDREVNGICRLLRRGRATGDGIPAGMVSFH